MTTELQLKVFTVHYCHPSDRQFHSLKVLAPDEKIARALVQRRMVHGYPFGVYSVSKGYSEPLCCYSNGLHYGQTSLVFDWSNRFHLCFRVQLYDNGAMRFVRDVDDMFQNVEFAKAYAKKLVGVE